MTAALPESGRDRANHPHGRGRVRLLSSVAALTTLVGVRIRPIKPGTAERLPRSRYSLTADPTTQYLGGAIPLTPCSLTVAVYAPDLSAVSAALTGIKATLNGYHSDDVKRCFFTGQTGRAGRERHAGHGVRGSRPRLAEARDVRHPWRVT